MFNRHIASNNNNNKKKKKKKKKKRGVLLLFIKAAGFKKQYSSMDVFHVFYCTNGIKLRKAPHIKTGIIN